MFTIACLIVGVILIGAVLHYRDNRTFTLPTYLLMVGLSIPVLSGAYFLVRYSAFQSVEIWHGRITHKNAGTEHCCHCTTSCSTCTDSNGSSYSCNCVEICSHSYDHYWSVDVSTGDEVVVDRCEPFNTPPKVWVEAAVGDPASVEHHYTNYLLADADSLLNRTAGATFLNRVPENYPRVYNHFHTRGFVAQGVNVPPEWSEGIQQINADLGSRKQIDILLYFTSIQDPTFADAVESKWLYGPKNALIIVMGVKDNTITWTRVVTISRVEALKIALRDQLTGISIDDHKKGLDTIRQNVVQGFQRTPMEAFKYLESAMTLSLGWNILLGFLVLLYCGIFTYVVYRDRNRCYGFPVSRLGYRSRTHYYR